MSDDYRMNFSDDAQTPSGVQLSEKKSEQPPTKSLVLAGFVFMSAAALVFGGVTIVHNIAAPFKSSLGILPSAQSQNKAEDESVANEQRLKSIDTDGDALFDWEELNTYHTSPYLADTDGDSYADKEEIDSGHDPLCAQGKQCAPAAAVLQGAPPDSGSLNPQPSTLNPAQPTPEQIRGILVQKGLSPEQAAQLSESDLLDIYRQSVDNEDAPVVSADPKASSPSQTEPQPAQIRKVLLESGKFTAAQLQKIDDATLLSLYRQALARQQQQGIK